MSSRNTFVTNYIYGSSAIKVIGKALRGETEVGACHFHGDRKHAGYFAGRFDTVSAPPYTELHDLLGEIDVALKQIRYPLHFDIAVVGDDDPAVLHRKVIQALWREHAQQLPTESSTNPNSTSTGEITMDIPSTTQQFPIVDTGSQAAKVNAAIQAAQELAHGGTITISQLGEIVSEMTGILYGSGGRMLPLYHDRGIVDYVQRGSHNREVVVNDRLFDWLRQFKPRKTK
jgi:hypothetical protein